MFARSSLRFGSTKFHFQKYINRFLGTPATAKLDVSGSTDKACEYANALPYSSIPGPSLVSLLLSNLPGGTFYKKDFREMIRLYREQYGDLMKLPSVFGKPAVVCSYNPEHFQAIFRTEGQWPDRLGLETVKYYREKVRPDIYGKYQGLLTSQGEEWGKFRKIVNPVMIQPKNAKLYIPIIDEVSSDFLKRVKQIRNPSTNQLPENFEAELNRWALESVGVIALNTRLGLISDSPAEKAVRFMEAAKDFIEISFILDLQPSIWRLFATPTFKKFLTVMNTMTDTAGEYIKEAQSRLQANSLQLKNDHEQSVLEKLLKIDANIATVMAMDMFFAGVDTIGSNVPSSAEIEYSKAAPYSSIPGPSAAAFVLANMPGGRYYKMSLIDIIKSCREQYGELMKLPGVFGNPDALISHDPDHFQTLFRTEGIWPSRQGFQTLVYFREKIRPDIFGKHQGLMNSQGKEWGDFRKTVNPVMIQPKTTKLYIPIVDEVASEFLERIRQIRDPTTNQLPSNFEDDLNRWALESIGVIGLDTRLGLISDKHNERAAKLIESVKVFFELVFELEFRPSVWKIVATPTFKKLIAALNTMTDASSQYIDEAEERLKKKQSSPTKEHEESILQKLLKIDPLIAKVMAMDMLFAGVDTTSSAFTSILYVLAKNPDKQEILRKEILTVLPKKNSSFTIESMSRLPYLRACIKESQRLFPTVNGNVRGAGRDLVLNGYQVPKGTQVVMNTPVLELDEEYFTDALKFLPERWLKQQTPQGVCPASTKSTHPFVYLPFGFGPRMCIGRRLAEMEIEILISKVVRNFHVTWEQPDLKFKWKTLNVPDGKLMFTLKEIDK